MAFGGVPGGGAMLYKCIWQGCNKIWGEPDPGVDRLQPRLMSDSLQIGLRRCISAAASERRQSGLLLTMFRQLSTTLVHFLSCLHC